MKMKLLALALLAAPLIAAPPRITNGTLQSAPSLAQGESAGAGWIGFAFTTAKPMSITCCGDNISIHRDDRGEIHPAGSSAVVLFARYDAGQVVKIRLYSPDCALDAGGQTVRWVESVSPVESLQFLRRVVTNGDSRARNGALLALSLHANATDTLIDFARNSADAHVRGQALFWLAQSAGEKAAATLRHAVDNDPDQSVRAKAVFGISQLPDDESIPLLIDLLKHNRSREVRKKAAFWLGQKKDPRALAAIEEILRQ